MDQMRLPEPLPVQFANIPALIQEYPNWVVWRYAIIDGEVKKPPYNPVTGRLASIRKSSTWSNFERARSTYETGQFSGIGFVLEAALGIVGIDLDDCVVERNVAVQAQGIISTLNSDTEISPSGTGIRILLTGKLPGVLRRRDNVEMYEDLRYVTITGQHLPNTPQDILSRNTELAIVYQRIFGVIRQALKRENTVGGGTNRAKLTRSDQEVVELALRSKSGSNFRRYWYGDSSLWEGSGARHKSQSEADFTFVLQLLYWTNDDTSQVDRLFRQSGLMRTKWDRRYSTSETYGDRVISDAIRKRYKPL